MLFRSPKFSLKNSEIGPAALAEKIGIDVSIREPEAKQEDGVEQESLFYRIRGAYYRCEQRGCILFGGAR